MYVDVLDSTNPSTTEPAIVTTPTTEPATQPTVTTPTTPPSEVCGGPGWRRVAFINMTDPNQNCPQGLSLTSYSIRSCGRGNIEGGSCSSVVFSVNSLQYSQVCGRVTAYRWGWNHAFHGYHRVGETIDGYYVDGISLTHGSPRTHIWTFTSGQFSGTSVNDSVPYHRCPCDLGNIYSSPPFVGNDYFCDSVATVDNYLGNDHYFYADNALWDGKEDLNPCYGLNNPPWFYKNLSFPTTDDIELRMCLSNGYESANLAIKLLEVYVSNT